MGHIACTAFAKYHLNLVPTVVVDDGELMVRGVRRARVTTVSKMADIPERMERSPVEKPILPALGVMSMNIKAKLGTRTYLHAMQWQRDMPLEDTLATV